MLLLLLTNLHLGRSQRSCEYDDIIVRVLPEAGTPIFSIPDECTELILTGATGTEIGDVGAETLAAALVGNTNLVTIRLYKICRI